MALLMFFRFCGQRKNEKKDAAGRRDGWRMGEDDGGGAAMRAAGRLVVLVVLVVRVCGAATIKVCNCTAFDAVDGGGSGYFCTDASLHRRRRWIGCRRR